MVKIDDEMLMAYADGALDPTQTAEVEALLAGDAKAAETVRVFRESGRLAASAFDGILREPVPERLVRAASGVSEAADSGVVVDFAKRRQQRQPAAYGRMALPLAAAIALMIGVAGGFGVSRLDQPAAPAALSTASLTEVPVFQETMENARSNVPVAWQGASGESVGEIMPVLTFRDAAGEICREFRTTLASADATEIGFGVACRRDDAAWRTEILVAGPTIPQSAPAGGGMTAATGGAGDNEAQFRQMVDDLIGDDVLSGEAEAELIANGWQ